MTGGADSACLGERAVGPQEGETWRSKRHVHIIRESEVMSSGIVLGRLHYKSVKRGDDVGDRFTYHRLLDRSKQARHAPTVSSYSWP